MTQRLNIFNSVEKDLKNHLNLLENNRIIFSGRFGSGKTSFINHFFSAESQQRLFKKVRYNVVHLYPVNYSIASNEDIFRYLKYDILCDLLLNKKVDVSEQKSHSSFESLKKYGGEHFDKIIASFLPLIPLIGKDAADLFDSLYKIKEEYLAYHNKNSESDADKLYEFIEKMELHGLYETDFVTKFIEESLLQLKEVDKENILIIDDLDRIDPEHIFRILNVFAAHFDTHPGMHDGKEVLTLKNKFGFDRIILICDIKNIHNIFKAKYGETTDFSGYIDKFYSKEVFHFSVGKALKTYITSFISTISGADRTKIYSACEDGRLEFLLNVFLDYNLISIRQLIKVFNSNPLTENEFEREVSFTRNIKIPVIRHSMLIRIEILSKIFGGYDPLYKAIVSLENRYSASYGVDGTEVNLFGSLLVLRSYKVHSFGSGAITTDSYSQGPSISSISYIIRHVDSEHVVIGIRDQVTNKEINLNEQFSLFTLFREVLELLETKKFFN